MGRVSYRRADTSSTFFPIDLFPRGGEALSQYSVLGWFPPRGIAYNYDAESSAVQ
ncbi:hypothetical protein PS874_00341 [Pseudomonas fluorescens]|jgi:hypothetical protein|nr:hypothetical protein PS874_00341 [Pseudomonas fluorescens]